MNRFGKNRLKKIEIHRDFIDIKWRLKSTKELSYINNETNLTNSTWTSPLNNSGTINVEAGATLKLAGQVNAATKAYQNKVGTINISGTVITDTPCCFFISYTMNKKGDSQSNESPFFRVVKFIVG